MTKNLPCRRKKRAVAPQWPIAWDTGKKRWFPLYPNDCFAPDDPLHWTGRYQNWNAMCADCHSTDLKKNYDPAMDTYRTAWSEIGVGCAPCHARRSRLVVADRPASPSWTATSRELLRAGRHHADGRQLDEVYVYGSFLQSKMFARGVRCSDCHDPHSLTLRAEGNAVCTRCHRAQPEARFPTLAAKAYDTPAHHFHKADSPGTRCVTCHMPAKTYMIVQPRPDHSLRVPRPDLSVKLGTPDACTQCHTERSPRWAADAVAKWYGPHRRQETHFGEVFAAARAGKRGAEPGLVALAGEQNQPIVRASALDLLRGYGASGLAAAAGLERAQPTSASSPRRHSWGIRSAPSASRRPACSPERRPTGHRVQDEPFFVPARLNLADPP